MFTGIDKDPGILGEFGRSRNRPVSQCRDRMFRQLDARNDGAGPAERCRGGAGPDAGTAAHAVVLVDDGLEVVTGAIAARLHRDRAERAIVETAGAAVAVVEIDDCRGGRLQGRNPRQGGEQDGQTDEDQPQLSAGDRVEQGVCDEVVPVEVDERRHNVEVRGRLADSREHD